MEEVDFNVFGAEASIHVSGTGAGYSAKVNLVGGKVSIFELELGVGVSSEIGLIDDSVAVRFLGVEAASAERTRSVCLTTVLALTLELCLDKNKSAIATAQFDPILSIKLVFNN